MFKLYRFYCKGYIVQFILYRLFCTVYTVHYLPYRLYCTRLHNTGYTAQFILYRPYCKAIMCRIYSTGYTVQGYTAELLLFKLHCTNFCTGITGQVTLYRLYWTGYAVQVIVCSFYVWHSEDRASWYILITKPTRCTNFSNLFLEQNSTCFGQVFCPSSGV